MLMLKIAALCVAAAMICQVLRVQRPELATAVALGTGAAALALLAGGADRYAPAIQAFKGLIEGAGNGMGGVVLKGAGIALLSEAASQICRDAGESSLAGRVSLAARAAILALCLPLLVEIGEALGGLD